MIIKIKRWFSVVLCMLLCVGLLSTTVYAQEKSIDLEMDHYTLELNPDTQTATVTSSWTGIDLLEIPETITHENVTYTVTSIADRAFYQKGFKQIILPDTIETIGESAFYNCYALVHMNIPTSLKTIGKNAFQSCNYWEDSIVIPEGVTEIPYRAFHACYMIKGITFPSTLKTIGEEAFFNVGLRAGIEMPMTIPSNITFIGHDAFLGTNITKVTIPEGRTEMLELDGAFRACDKLESVEILSDKVNIGNLEFASCDTLSNIILADGITSIGQYAFSHSPNDDPNFVLKEVVIPDSVTTMGNPFFDYCRGATIYYPSKATSPSTFKETKTQVGYSVNQDGTVTIDSVNGTALAKTPEDIKGKKVSAVPEEYKAEGKHFHYYRENEVNCVICGLLDPNHVHTFGNDWVNNETDHWHECDCGAKTDEDTHTFKWIVDKEATHTEKGSKHEECSVCGYKKASVEILVLTPTNPEKPNIDKPNTDKPNSDKGSPETGDQTNVGLFTSLSMISALGIAVLTVWKKKEVLDNK